MGLLNPLSCAAAVVVAQDRRGRGSGTPGCAVNEPSSFEVQYRVYELAVAHVRDAGVVPAALGV
jgi:hypothetical protein